MASTGLSVPVMVAVLSQCSRYSCLSSCCLTLTFQYSNAVKLSRGGRCIARSGGASRFSTPIDIVPMMGSPDSLATALLSASPTAPQICACNAGVNQHSQLSPYGHIQQVHISRDGELVSSRSLICPFNVTIKVQR